MVCIICTRIMSEVIQITSVLSLHSINCYARSSDFPAHSVPVVICDVITCVYNRAYNKTAVRSLYTLAIPDRRLQMADWSGVLVVIRAMEVIVRRRRFSSKCTRTKIIIYKMYGGPCRGTVFPLKVRRLIVYGRLNR